MHNSKQRSTSRQFGHPFVSCADIVLVLSSLVLCRALPGDQGPGTGPAASEYRPLRFGADPIDASYRNLGDGRSDEPVDLKDKVFAVSNVKKLLEKLGADYDPTWMSIDRPPELDNDVCIYV